VRRALELLRRGVEIGRSEHLKATVVARLAAAAAAKQPAPSDHDVVVEWREGDTALVKRAHVTEAQKEMFGALHLQLLRSRSLWDKVLLVAVVVEARATGRSAVVMQVGVGLSLDGVSRCLCGQASVLLHTQPVLHSSTWYHLRLPAYV
jgi:hypothetical protein